MLAEPRDRKRLLDRGRCCELATRAMFSIAHDITSAQAWVAALVMMALAEVIARLATIRLRAHQLPRTQASTAQVATEI
jgi:hypothetical protein